MKITLLKSPSDTLLPYSRLRRAAQDLAVLQRKHLIHALFEADVTPARAIIQAHELQTGEQLSFTAFTITCVARAVDEDKTMQAYRKGKRRLVVFDDVDVTTLMEREVEGQKQALFHIVRAANHRTLGAIHAELRAAQAAPPRDSGMRLFELLPGWLRRLALRVAGRRPRILKAFGGTVTVTAVGMFAPGSSGWGIPITTSTLDVTIGGIGAKPGVVDGAIAIREYLSLTVSVDHDVVDGARAARFAARLKQLIERGYGLPGYGLPKEDAAMAEQGRAGEAVEPAAL